MYISSGTVVRNSKTDTKQLSLHTLETVGCEVRGPQTNKVLAVLLSGPIHTCGGGRMYMHGRGCLFIYMCAWRPLGNPGVVLKVQATSPPLPLLHWPSSLGQWGGYFCCPLRPRDLSVSIPQAPLQRLQTAPVTFRFLIFNTGSGNWTCVLEHVLRQYTDLSPARDHAFLFNFLF